MFRIIKKHNMGFVVQIKKRTWYGRHYWKHFISVYGIESEPWYHSTYEYAMISLLDEIKKQTSLISTPCRP